MVLSLFHGKYKKTAGDESTFFFTSVLPSSSSFHLNVFGRKKRYKEKTVKTNKKFISRFQQRIVVSYETLYTVAQGDSLAVANDTAYPSFAYLFYFSLVSFIAMKTKEIKKYIQITQG